MTEQEQALKVLRDQIDSIDKQIHLLLNQRASCAQRVAEVKQQFQGEEIAVFYRPEREAQVLKRVMERNEGPLADKEVARLFREIMSVCLALEKPMRVAFLGPEGTFTQQAALKHFGHSAESAPMNSLDQVFREVEAGAAHYGVVPIENSSEGMATHTLDLFKRFNLRICGELELKIHHHLLVQEKTDSASIRRIYAHQESFAQCHSWLDAHYPHAEHITVSSNAEGARLASKEVGTAAIAGDMAMSLYQLEVLERNIEDQPDNTTRFLIIGDQDVGASGDDKTSILMSAHDKPGVLYSLLEPFHRHGISLTRIETRPAGQGGWSYMFYIDFEGHVDDPKVQKVLSELESGSVELKLLGSYPKAVL
ncbi:prephenate dehydratase [Neptunomonas qingdaonensis]|uniref:Bifunctional chorismate mutase/prephenate dehydratase n=1 Tax=Neptunomonas qingdaonensis TaxID=1045558 RepID=A0A1I2MPA4_9GAMM|nr:prephenate dehydratase [Neptunomonas qingdaonensis]SFF93273.1 chorismate mutase [Neptunomonas qingdaonensis]